MKHTLSPSEKVPQPTNKKWEPHYKSASIIFHYPHHWFTQKEEHIKWALTILHLYSEPGKTRRACLHFLGHWHQTLFWQKLKGRKKATTMASDFDCNLNPGEQLNLCVWDQGERAYNGVSDGTQWKKCTPFLRSMKGDCFQAWQY